MDKQLLKECIGAILVAAITNKWSCVLDLPLKDVVEQLEETNTKTPEAAVQMFQDYVQSLMEDAEQAAGWDAAP